LKVKAIFNNHLMYVCLCKGVSDRTVRACIRAGAGTVHEVGKGCGAGTDCGACRSMIDDLIEEHAEEHSAASHRSLPMLQSA
jgi:bacterioferritin-associated ferredoxin